MSYRRFRDHFPELAEQETRVIRVLEPSPFPGVPAGEYALLELFCTDEDCDCRRVMWMVTSEREKSTVAVVAYGWGNAAFYREWLGRDDPEIIREMQGPVLNMASSQSSYAPSILNMLTRVIVPDKSYIHRVKRHYALFRNRIETGARFLS